MIYMDNVRHLFIVNPVAGGRDRTEDIVKIVDAEFSERSDEYEIYITQAPMDAADKVRSSASLGGELRVYACGGDGTFNECVCGAIGLENVSVAPFPVGTGNDFCRMFGPEQELYRSLPALLNGVPHPIDVIDCSGRYSVNLCSVGIDARIGTNVHKYTSIPLIGSSCGYVISAVVEMFRGISTHMKITCGDLVLDGEYSLVCACNGRYYGGGFNPSLTAMPDDGILDIFIVKKVNIFQFAALIGKYSTGRSDELKKYVTHVASDSICIEFDEDNVVNLDGEAFHAKKADMKILHGAVTLIVPEGMKYFESQTL